MLIKCPECGQSISDKALACPHCGMPKSEMNNKPFLMEYDSNTMEGVTPRDQQSIDISLDLYGDLLVGTDGRVWNDGGQLVGMVKFK